MKIRFWKIFGLLIVTVVFVYIYAGFFNSDTFLIKQLGIKKTFMFLWAPRIILPFFYFAVVYTLWKWNKKVLANTILFVGVFILAFFFAFFFADLSYHYRLSKNNEKMEVHSFLQLNPNLSELENFDTTNSKLNIFCVGGSTTEFRDKNCLGWTDYLQEDLNINSDSVQVFNLGRQWYSSLHVLINYETNLRKYKPDVIIVMEAINDLLQNADFSYFSNGSFREDYGHFNGPLKDIFKRTGFSGELIEKLHTVWYSNNSRQLLSQDSFPGIAAFGRNLNTLIDLAKLDDTEVILMTQPNIYKANMTQEEKDKCIMVNFEAVGENFKWDYETARRGMDLYNNKIREIAGKRNVYLVDLDKLIPKSLDYFYDEVHYKEGGFELVGNAISNEMRKNNMLKSKKLTD